MGSPYLALQHTLWPNEVVKYVFGHVSIHGRQRVIQEVNFSITVQSPSQTHPLPLPS